MVLEYVGVIMASIALELLVSPSLLVASLFVATALGAACAWACWRSGSLIHLAHRPGAGTLILATVAGTVIVWSVVSLSSVEYARRTFLGFTDPGNGAAQRVALESESLCRAAESLLSSIRSGMSSPPRLNCDSPRATESMKNVVAYSGDVLRSAIHSRLRWNQLQTVLGGLVVLAISFGISSWRGNRNFRVQVSPTFCSYSL